MDDGDRLPDPCLFIAHAARVDGHILLIEIGYRADGQASSVRLNGCDCGPALDAVLLGIAPNAPPAESRALVEQIAGTIRAAAAVDRGPVREAYRARQARRDKTRDGGGDETD